MALHSRLQSMLVAATGAALALGGTYQPAAAETRTAPLQLAQAATVVPTSSIQQQTLYLSPDRPYSYNLEVERGVTLNGLTIPAGAEIQGQYRPADGGLRYVANAVIVNGRTYDLNARSQVLHDVKDPRDTSTGSIAEDAGIGAAGGLILGELFGDAGLAGAVGGAAAGAATGNVTADRVVVVEPEEPINLY